MDEEGHLLHLNQLLLDSIAQADWETYERLCADDLTAFEPEAAGCLVQGLDFHRFYFASGGLPGRHNTTMAAPHVRHIGDVAIVSYVRLIQEQNDRESTTIRFEETRIWHKIDDHWKHVHFHRSKV